MTKELELRLVKEFPSFFRDYGGDPHKTCMACGIEHGDGWFELFLKLNTYISEHINGLAVEKRPDFHWLEAKEKFGTARWYYNNGDDTISKLVSIFEDKSGETCEGCGQPGKVAGPRWLRCLCVPCREKRNK